MSPPRFRHLPNRPGQAPSELESRIFEGVSAALAAEKGPLPRVICVPDVAAVFTSETVDSEGRPCVGLVVAMKETGP